MSTKPRVSIVMGSDSDLDIMRESAKALEEFGIEYEIDVTSAHRSPERTAEFARKAAGRGVRVIIAGAGGAAHLAGVIAAHTSLPVIGVPIPSTSLQGMDSLLATVQMPAGIPVATVAIGKPGATNAGILAAQILALSNVLLEKKLAAHKEKLANSVDEKSRKLQDPQIQDQLQKRRTGVSAPHSDLTDSSSSDTAAVDHPSRGVSAQIPPWLSESPTCHRCRDVYLRKHSRRFSLSSVVVSAHL